MDPNIEFPNKSSVGKIVDGQVLFNEDQKPYPVIFDGKRDTYTFCEINEGSFHKIQINKQGDEVLLSSTTLNPSNIADAKSWLETHLNNSGIRYSLVDSDGNIHFLNSDYENSIEDPLKKVSTNTLQNLWGNDTWNDIIQPRIQIASENDQFMETKKITFHDDPDTPHWQRIQYQKITIEEKDYYLISTQDISNEIQIIDSIVDSLGLSLEDNEIETREHCHRVMKITEEFSLHLFQSGHLDDLIDRKLREEGIRNPTKKDRHEVFEKIQLSMMYGAILHDIGKKEMMDIINKKGKLSDEDWKTVRKHPEMGVEIFDKEISQFSEILYLDIIRNMILHHHQQWNGKGYPKNIFSEPLGGVCLQGLRAFTIPLEARIFKLIDVLDALLYKRSYKDAYSLDDAIKEINKMSDEFDPNLLELFITFIQ